ncbi:MAG TPA: ATP-binding protein [Trebonia sp.]
MLRGDPLLLHQLVANLIDNAVGHNIAGGDILVATGTSDSRAIVSVANSGQVIAPAEVDRLLQPFQRLGTRSARRGDGHGLGLSIAAAITAAHDARLTLRPRPGGGLAVRVVFPAQPLSGHGRRGGSHPVASQVADSARRQPPMHRCARCST